MGSRRVLIGLVTGSLGLCFAGQAHAITVPDSGSCSTTGACLSISQSGAGYGLQGGTSSSGGIGVVGSANPGIAGVYGWSVSQVGVYGVSNAGDAIYGSTGDGAGVHGVSTNNIGVYGSSTNYNAIYGLNNDTNGTAATISAQPGSTSGLAYWGGGNIYLQGSTAWKAGGGSWTATSDRRVKKDVRDLNQGLAELLKVRPIRFKYNGLGGTTDDGKEFVGVIAQDLEKVLPSMVSTRVGKLHPGDTKDTAIEQVDPSNFTYLLINAVQEQQRVIQRQEARIDALEHGAPLSSSVLPLGRAETFAFGLLPVGLIVALRRRKGRTK